MIYYISTARHTYTVKQFLKHWAPDLAGIIKVLPYPGIVLRRALSPGTYIFADLERLSPEVSALLAVMRDKLAGKAGFRVLNHPAGSMRRCDLLNRLAACGINEFAVYPLVECPAPKRFPVFVRHESDHKGNITALINNQAEFDRVVRKTGNPGTGIWRRLVVEFLDTADGSGIYRKYSAFRIGDRIIPRHLFFSRHWMIKEADLVIEETIREERDYVKTNPHELQLMKIFDLARIEYGRIDYGMWHDKIQVWEINTNPMLVGRKNLFKPERKKLHEEFAAKAREAFSAIDFPGGMGDCGIPPPMRTRLLAALARSLCQEARHQDLRTFLGR